jgi:cupin 2 domain-containing protein
MNLFEIPRHSGADGETLDKIAQIAGVRIERIVSTGQCSPDGFWYDQDHDEWVAVLQGEGVLGFEGRPHIWLSRGETLMIPAHQKHRVVSTSVDPPCIWLALHGPSHSQS